MKITDRGTKKWTSLMLTEHVEMLKELWDDMEKVEKPILDEQQWQETELNINVAMEYSSTVEVTYYKSGYILKVVGEIENVDLNHKILRLKNNEVAKVKFEDLLELSIL